ncbi:hypothetical protein K7X08_029980 [Anisodus acutangulus]|uniref:DNA mismatch repair proteins mutS family domain-containing protein n=1 Tax=Anisodus acutangulus TaxID=402998 RepID=A0A9Q1LL76_9SOLA|nr:hypothetical protein K7X08_029980 [Anisodus acutangulus]
MSNEQLFFGLSQALLKFPKETDRVLCHFCFKPKRVTNEVLASDNGRRSQIMISSIILLKTALDALPLLSKVLKEAKSFLLGNVYKTVCENEKYTSIRKRIGEVIDEDVLHTRVPFVARTQQCFDVKAGADGLLDMARRSFCDTSEALMDAIRESVYVLTVLSEVLCLLDMMEWEKYLSSASLLMVILAQIGCYIPARFATLRVVDRIFTRMGTMDSLESNSSTFMTEKETAFIMQNISHRSLIVRDELGRTTSSSDGFAIAWSCCTQYLLLIWKILHFDVDVRNNRMDFKDGSRHVPHYDLMLAGVAGLPSSVVETAKRITSRITQKEMKRMEVNCRQYEDVQLTYRVAQRLMCLKYSDQDEHNLKESYIGRDWVSRSFCK